MIEPRKTSSLWSEDNFPTKREGVLGADLTTMGAGLRTVSKEKDRPPDPKVRASTQSTTVVPKERGMHPKG